MVARVRIATDNDGVIGEAESREEDPGQGCAGGQGHPQWEARPGWAHRSHSDGPQEGRFDGVLVPLPARRYAAVIGRAPSSSQPRSCGR